MGCTPNMPIYLQLAQSRDERILHPGSVVEAHSLRAVILLEDPDLPIEVGAAVKLYFAVDGRFRKQPVRVTRMSSEPPEVEVEFIGEDVSAETREQYRASAFGHHVYATFDGEPACEVVDVSDRGLALYAGHEHPAGRVLEIELDFADVRAATGHVSIQSARRLAGGRFRYGLLSVDGWDAGGLRKALTRISRELQRRMMARLAGRR